MERRVTDHIAVLNGVGSFPVTTSVYDMGDRRTEVNHPASGITSFTYDPLGNVLTKQTANMAEEGKMITYTYDYHRLTGISYPDHPENNVKYYYGGRNASYNRIGRLMMREDGTGAIEYFYGKMGEVTKTRRTLIVPNQAIATYVTQWTYDSHNRLIEMIYPDEEKVTYSYNLGGLLEKVRGEKSYGYDYITKLGYDKFEQRSYLKYCNGAETFYTYDNRRRLSNLAVNSGGASIMDNAYTFDAVSNVLSVSNNASLPANGNGGGQMSHTYTYDGLYRLATATGTYTGADNKSASYTLAMGYDNMHRIKSKSQHLTQDNVQFNGTLNVGYDLTYTYGSEAGKKFQLESVKDVNYRTEETPGDNNVENGHVYTYDKNGNLVYVNTSRMMTDGHRDNSVGERKLIWDEENRLLAVDDNGFVSNYWYDADGERTVKTSGESDQVYVNGVFSGGSTNTAKFSLYVSPYLVANQGGRYTKHIYAGSQRIVSKVGDFASYGSDPRRIEYAGANTDGLSVDYKSKYAAQQQVIKDNYKFFDVPYNGTDNDNYADGEGFCCNDGSMEAAVAEARKAQTRAVSRSFKDPDNYENLQFFYHPDHLGSSSFITNLDGEVVQHIEYVPFGEVFIEERNNVWNTPYLFNAKEFDEETGMYYYGARYYNPQISIWMSVDPLSEYVPSHTPYRYCFNNPIKYIDLYGLFEDENQATLYQEKYGVGGKIESMGDGSFAINDYENCISYSAGDDSFMSADAHPNDGVIESALVTNRNSPYSWTDLNAALGAGNSAFTFWFNSLSTAQKSKYTYDLSKYITNKTDIKLPKNSHIYRNVVPSGLKYIGYGSSAIAGGEIVWRVYSTRTVKSSTILDASIVGASFIPGVGWVIGVAYFGCDITTKLVTGKSIGDHLDSFIEENYGVKGGTLLQWE